MMYLVFLLGFYLGGMLIAAFGMYSGVIYANIDEPRAKILIWCIRMLAWPIVVPMAVYGLRKELKSRKTEY